MRNGYIIKTVVLFFADYASVSHGWWNMSVSFSSCEWFVRIAPFCSPAGLMARKRREEVDAAGCVPACSPDLIRARCSKGIIGDHAFLSCWGGRRSCVTASYCGGLSYVRRAAHPSARFFEYQSGSAHDSEWLSVTTLGAISSHMLDREAPARGFGTKWGRVVPKPVLVNPDAFRRPALGVSGVATRSARVHRAGPCAC